MLEDLRGFVELAETGSIARAADRLFRTPSAVTRKVQRLEAALGADLLDRTVKPPRLTPLGLRILEQARGILGRLDELRATASEDSAPKGPFRLGVTHALADEQLAPVVGGVSQAFPLVRLKLVSELTSVLFDRLKAGELDAAIVLLPAGRSAPAPLRGTAVAHDRMVVVGSRDRLGAGECGWRELTAHPWILNPPGCLLRAALIDELEAQGAPFTIAAEVHNPHVQLAFALAGFGICLLPKTFVSRRPREPGLVIRTPEGFRLDMTVALVRAGSLGALEAVAVFLEEHFRRALGDPDDGATPGPTSVDGARPAEEAR